MGALIQITPFPSRSIPSDGANHQAVYTNNTGQILYIRQSRVYLFPGGTSGGAGAIVGGLSGSILRGSDSSNLTYWAWDVNNNTVGSGPHGDVVAEDFGSNWFELDPGDTLTMNCYSTGFGGAASSASVWLWYTATSS
jgi:hypothetical protein